MRFETHVTCLEADGGISIFCTVVEELCQSDGGVFSCVGLFGREGAEGDQHGGVHRSCVVVRCTHDMLRSSNAVVVKADGGVIWFSHLLFCAVLDCAVRMW